MNSVDGADIYQRAVDKCKELIDDCNSLPELDGKGRLVVARSGEYAEMGRKIKKLADAKLSRKDYKAAMLDYVYASLHYYHSAEFKYEEENKAFEARQLLRETALLLIDSVKVITSGSALWKGLMQYMVAVCLGRAFFISSYLLDGQKFHKSVSRSVMDKQAPNADHMKALLIDSQDAYRAFEHLRWACTATRGVMDFPSDVMAQKYTPLEQTVDAAVLKITEYEKYVEEKTKAK